MLTEESPTEKFQRNATKQQTPHGTGSKVLPGQGCRRHVRLYISVTQTRPAG